MERMQITVAVQIASLEHPSSTLRPIMTSADTCLVVSGDNNIAAIIDIARGRITLNEDEPGLYTTMRALIPLTYSPDDMVFTGAGSPVMRVARAMIPREVKT